MTDGSQCQVRPRIDAGDVDVMHARPSFSPWMGLPVHDGTAICGGSADAGKQPPWSIGFCWDLVGMTIIAAKTQCTQCTPPPRVYSLLMSQPTLQSDRDGGDRKGAFHACEDHVLTGMSTSWHAKVLRKAQNRGQMPQFAGQCGGLQLGMVPPTPQRLGGTNSAAVILAAVLNRLQDHDPNLFPTILHMATSKTVGSSLNFNAHTVNADPTLVKVKGVRTPLVLLQVAYEEHG